MNIKQTLKLAATLTLLTLTSCALSTKRIVDTTEYTYLQKVRIKTGFYSGHVGVVIGQFEQQSVTCYREYLITIATVKEPIRMCNAGVEEL